MCLIIHKPAGQTIPRWIIDSAADHNPDGVGIMHGGKAHKYLRIKNAKVAKKINQLTEHEVAIHFRWRTDGTISMQNVHPFKLMNRSWLMHNGVLGKYRPGKVDGDISDTVKFCNVFVNPIIAKYGSIPRKMMESETRGNAILVMDRRGIMSRYGNSWFEYEGLWFSNEYAWDYPDAYKWWERDYAAEITGNYKPQSELVQETIDRARDSAEKATKRLAAKGTRRASGIVLPPPTQIATGTGFYDYSQELPYDNRIEMIDALYNHTDVLPYNDFGVIDYHDWELCDELMMGTIMADDFLHECSDLSLVGLYEWALNHGHIKEVA